MCRLDILVEMGKIFRIPSGLDLRQPCIISAERSRQVSRIILIEIIDVPGSSGKYGLCMMLPARDIGIKTQGKTAS